MTRYLLIIVGVAIGVSTAGAMLTDPDMLGLGNESIHEFFVKALLYTGFTGAWLGFVTGLPSFLKVPLGPTSSEERYRRYVTAVCGAAAFIMTAVAIWDEKFIHPRVEEFRANQPKILNTVLSQWQPPSRSKSYDSLAQAFTNAGVSCFSRDYTLYASNVNHLLSSGRPMPIDDFLQYFDLHGIIDVSEAEALLRTMTHRTFLAALFAPASGRNWLFSFFAMPAISLIGFLVGRLFKSLGDEAASKSVTTAGEFHGYPLLAFAFFALAATPALFIVISLRRFFQMLFGEQLALWLLAGTLVSLLIVGIWFFHKFESRRSGFL